MNLGTKLYSFLCTAEAITRLSSEELTASIAAIKGTRGSLSSQAPEVQFAEPLIVDFLEKTLEKRRMME